MKKLRGKDIAVFVLVLGILFAGVACFIGHGPSVTSASAAMTPEELAAENEALMKQAHDASMELQMIAAGGSKSANTWIEKYCKDRKDAPLPEDPAAANVELKARIREARTVFEEFQAEQRKEMHWLAQYYAEENEQTLEKLGIQSRKKTFSKFSASEELQKILRAITKVKFVLNGLMEDGYLDDHRKEFEANKNFDLGSVLNTPERMEENLRPYIKKLDESGMKAAVDFSSGRWSFHGNGKTCWIGYSLEGVSEDVRREMVQNSDVKRNGYKSIAPEEKYDGGDTLYWKVR